MRRALPRPRSVLLALVLAAPLCAGVGTTSARVALAEDAPWEKEVERAVAEQNGELERAKQQKSLVPVVRKYTNRVDRDPSALSHFLLGRAHYYDGNPVAARQQMDQALAADPRFYFAHVKIAQLLVELKNRPEAQAHLETVLTQKPGQPEALELLAALATEAKDWPRARRLLEERLSRDPGDLEIRRNLVVVHLQSRDWDAALRELRALRGREPENRTYRFMEGIALNGKGEYDAAAKVLEEVARDATGPAALDVLQALRQIYARRGDWQRVRATIERSMPYLSEAERKEAQAAIDRLKQGPPSASTTASPTDAPSGKPEISWSEVIRAADAPDVALRRNALRALHEGCSLGYVKEMPGSVLRRIAYETEPDPECRKWVVKILGTLDRPRSIPLLRLALSDEDADVRMLAAETMGETGQPACVAYLLPYAATDSLSQVEYEVVRSALARLTGFIDLPPGQAGVSTPAEVAASREAWRRWRLSDDSKDVKLRAIAQMIEFKEMYAERFLYDFVLDPSFEVMSEAYRRMRDAVRREGRDPVEKKVFPKFPAVPDAEVTRPAMRSLQERVAAWWADWIAERRAFQRTRSGGTPPPTPPGPTPGAPAGSR